MIILSLCGYSYDLPKSLSINPNGNQLVIGHSSGTILLVNTKGLKYEKSVKICDEIEEMSFDEKGEFLWVFGRNNNNSVLMKFETEDWNLKEEKKCEHAVFSSIGNKVCYKKDYFTNDLKVLDLTSGESVGTAKIKFKNRDGKIGYFELSGDGKKIIIAEKVFGGAAAEILIYSAEGLNASPENSCSSPKGLSDGFGTGVCTKNNSHIAIGWSETIRINEDSCESLDRGYTFCNSFCADPEGNFFFIGGSNEINRFEFKDIRVSKSEIEEISGASGKVISIKTLEGKDFYFITEDYIVGKINGDGFVLEQNLLSMNVDVILRDGYRADGVQKIKDACKKYKYKVNVPDEYDKDNPVVILSNVPMKKAFDAIIKMRKERVHCIVRLID